MFFTKLARAVAVILLPLGGLSILGVAIMTMEPLDQAIRRQD
jgi:hypothetical protein